MSMSWDSTTQLVVVSCSLLLGSLYLAFVFAQFVLIIQRANILHHHAKTQLALIWAASKSLGIPRSLIRRITGYHRFKSLIQQRAHEELLAELSKPLLVELKL